MRQIDLEFSFKGNRTYVHGTDIYKQIIQRLNALRYDHWHYFELNIKKITSHNLICFLTDERQRLRGEVANFILTQDQKQVYGSLIEDTDKEITSRYPFNENDITRHCIVDTEKESITYKNPHNTFAAIDVIVAISRFYLENLVDHSVKWFFRTIKFLRPIDDIKFQHMHLKKVLQKRNIVEFEVYIENELIGHAYGASI